MKNGLWLIGLIIGFLACSKPAKDVSVDPDGPDGPKNVTALLNDSTWYARGNAHKVAVVPGDVCTVNRFDFFASNELPYPKGVRRAAAQDCIACNTTQIFSFRKVPLTVGRYDVASLNPCSPNLITAVDYDLIIGGDAAFASYRALGANSGWIEVTRADTVAKVVEGKFELILVSWSDQSKTVRFRNGRFSARLAP